MAYQVLARKWRPNKFPEMVGQSHVLRVLINALDNQRLHHAYLFTGTRGVGKTTIARIFAKSLNCERGVSAHPCGECSSCREIASGRFVDLIEVDAASRTRVEDTRELLENVQYAPTRGRYKVYLIDEVHMLSVSSFNALLKTLEEPPQHVKFLLATTDPQKIPATILSRCLQFSLKRLPVEQISAHLQHILQVEQIAFDLPSLFYLAQAADGSMRDALSLLDQAIAFGGGQINQADTTNMLGTLDKNIVRKLVEMLALGDAEALLTQVAQVAELNPDYSQLLGDMLSWLQRIAVAQALPGTLDPQHPDTAAIRALAAQLTPQDIQLYYQIGIMGRRDLPFSPQLRGGFEMVLLRMLAFRPLDWQMATSATSATSAQQGNAIPASAKPPPHLTAPPSPSKRDDEWNTLIAQIPLSPLAKQLATHCALRKREGSVFYLVLPRQQAVLNQESQVAKLRDALSQQIGEAVQLRIQVESSVPDTPAAIQQQQVREQQQHADQVIRNDPTFIALEQAFDAKILDIKTID